MMRARLGVAMALLLGACDGGGGTDGGSPGVDAGGGVAVAHATAAWRMRCTTGDCPFEDPPARTIDHDHGQDGHEVRCDLQFDGTNRRMDLTLRGPDGYGFEVRGATIGLEGGRLMGSLCQIRVFEPGDVDLLTMCTASSPSPGSACQISRIDINEVDLVPTLTAELRCNSAPSEARPSEVRDVTSATSTSGNGTFAFRGCAGL